MARWFLTFEARNPANPESCWNVGVPEWLYKLHQNRGNEKQIARIVLVDEILRPDETVRLYRGWARPGQEESFVYQGRPASDHKSLTIWTPAPPGMAFLVFVLPDGTIDDWTWRSLRQGEGDEVEGIKGDLIWPKNRTC